jgi:glycosyltransferase involved in cell wall biosynthesis
MDQSRRRRALRKMASRMARFVGVVDVAARAEAIALRQDEFDARLFEVCQHQFQLQLARSVFLMMTYLGATEVAEDELVSVIMPTRNRAHLIDHAIRSVRAQSYRNWELIIVDDGSDDDTLKVVNRYGDRRIRVIRLDHRGPAAARNAALERVRGAYIVYCDDDNTMHEHWLRGVVWGFRLQPDAQVLIGARLLDDLDRSMGRARSGEPWLIVVDHWDRATLAEYNLADTMQIAHRAGLPARFDEDLVVCADWDYIAKLTEDRVPLCLPILAGVYMTTAHGRLMDSDRLEPERSLVRARVLHSNAQLSVSPSAQPNPPRTDGLA